MIRGEASKLAGGGIEPDGNAQAKSLMAHDFSRNDLDRLGFASSRCLPTTPAHDAETKSVSVIADPGFVDAILHHLARTSGPDLDEDRAPLTA